MLGSTIQQGKEQPINVKVARVSDAVWAQISSDEALSEGELHLWKQEPFFGHQMEKALQHNGVLGLAKPLNLSWSQTAKDLKMSAPGGAGICVRG